MPTATVLGLLAVLLLGPVPWYLQRARWTAAEPRAALVVWQAVGLAAGLAAVGATAALALAPLGHGLLGGVPSLLAHLATGAPAGGLDTAHALLLLIPVALSGRLLGALILAAWRTLRARRRHRALLDLLGRPLADRSGLVLDHPGAAAYCLPGTLPGAAPRVVVTAGLLDLLDRDELGAVLAHEDAHLAEHHDLVVLPFAAWSSALRFLPTVRASRAAVDALVEMVADDRACARVDRTVLACALARFGTATGPAGVPAGALAAAGPPAVTLARVHRLLDPPARSAALRLALYAAATVLLVVPTLGVLFGA